MRIKSLFLILIILLAGCGGIGTSSTSPYPDITQRQLEIKSTVQGDFELDWNATPQVGKSIIKGKLIIENSSILVGELYLANAVPTSNPDVFLLELDQERAPKAIIDRKTGRFIFRDVIEGIYGIIVWEPLNSFPINDRYNGQTLFIDVRANKIIELGDVHIP